MSFRRLLFLINILTFHQLGFCQRNSVHYYEIGPGDGLQNSEFNDGFESSNGFIWITASNGGVARFDGSSVTEITDASISKGGDIEAMEAKDGMIWVTSTLLGEKYKSITIYDPRNEQSTDISSFFRTQLPFDVEKVTSIFKNLDGTIWICSGKKVFEYDGENFQLWSANFITSDRFVQKISNSLACVINREEVPVRIQYISRSGKLLNDFELNIGTSAFFLPILQEDQLNETTCYLEAVDNRNSTNTLLTINVEGEITEIDSVVNSNFRSFKSNGDVIYKLDRGLLSVFKKDLSELFHFQLKEDMELLFGDSQNGVWLTKGRAHLIRVYLNEGKFDLYQNFLKDKIWYTASRGIAEGVQNDLFMIHGGTIVNIRADGSKQLIQQPEQEKVIPDYFGMFLSKDKKTLWVTDAQLVWKLNPKTFEFTKRYKIDDVKLNWKPYEDRDGAVWIGTSNGLYYYDSSKDKMRKYLKDNRFSSLRTSSVFEFYENERGLWVVSSKGLYLLDRNKGIIEHYHTGGTGKFYLPHNTIVHLQEDSDGTFWLASKGGGLIHYFPKTGKFKQFTTKNTLKNDVIYACYLDDYGQIWLPSNNGLMRFDKRTQEIIHYTEVDGIPHLEFNTISHFKDKDGNLYFGGLNGTIGFDPKDLIPKKGDQAIEITGFQKLNYSNEAYVSSYKNLLTSKKIVLTPEDKIITLRFALTSLSDPKNHTYQYKIVGYDSNWVNLEEPELTISGLPYGSYEILLRAQSTGNTWQYYKHPIELEVVKPLYLRWWFIGLMILIAVLLIFTLLKWQTYRLRKRQTELESIVEERTHEIVKQAEELKTLDRMKSQFFANISHELRTPLTLILGPVNALQEESKREQGSKKLEQKLSVIERNANNLLGIVEEVLELSKLNAGKVELVQEDVALKSYLKQINSSFESIAELRNINFRFIYHPSVKLQIKLDKTKFEKIINNLLSNAFKFSSDGGEIHVEVSEKESSILFSVSDTGAGIDEEDLPFVFDRFYQSKSPKFTAHGGTGIGLALCLEMTKLMNGKIWAESTVDVGSRFFVEIPKILSNGDNAESAHFKVNSENEASDPAALRRNGRTILLVEDNTDMREYVRSLLSGDHTILMAENGQKGLKLLAQKGQEIDLVISDVMMPVMDGFTMLEKMKEHEKWRNIPVIMLTARVAEEDKLHALTIGVDDYLTKPFSTAELQARVKNLLENYDNRKLWQEDLLKIPTSQANVDTSESEDDEIETKEVSKQDLIWTKKVKSVISENMANEDFDVETLAQELFLSKRQFERKVKKITGLSPAKIILEVRLLKARDLLEKDTFQSVSEVSYAIGIQTPSYFSKLYLTRFGKRPTEYFS